MVMCLPCKEVNWIRVPEEAQRGEHMKKFRIFIIVVVVVISLLVIFFASTIKVGASNGCPDWLYQIAGGCANGVLLEQPSDLPDYDTIIYDWSPDRILVVETFNAPVPILPTLLGSNLNKWRLVPEWVYIDGRTINGLQGRTLFIGSRLMCDIFGSKSPRLTISIPKSEFLTRWSEVNIYAIYFTITNMELLKRPCSY